MGNEVLRYLQSEALLSTTRPIQGLGDHQHPSILLLPFAPTQPYEVIENGKPSSTPLATHKQSALTMVTVIDSKWVPIRDIVYKPDLAPFEAAHREIH